MRNFSTLLRENMRYAY